MKILKRALRILGAVIAVALLFIAGSIVIEGALGGGRVDALTNTRINAADGSVVRAFVARPSAPGPHPAVVMIHEFWGLKPDIVGKAQALADEGYVVIAPDAMRGGSTSSIPRAIFQVSTTKPAQVDADLDAVFAWAAQQPEIMPDKIAVLGFCFGGGAALRYSVDSGKPAATVLFYGTPIADPELIKHLGGPVLGVFGGADVTISEDRVRAMERALNAAGVKNEIGIYPGQPHAFVSDVATIRAGGAAGQAWAQMLTFLKANLAGGSARIAVPRPALTNASPDLEYALALAVAHLGHHAH